jgi:hypothetical protein
MERGSRMSSASVSPRGFVAVRGRGYRPDQVDAYAAAISQYRDVAWERAARLTVLAKDMEAEAERMRVAVSRLAPQTYETLGERAQRLFQLGVEEAAALRESARRAAEEQVAEAEACAAGVLQAARECADALRAEVEERARQRLLAARAEADDIRIGARREVKEGRTEALSALREVRQRTAAMLGEQAKEHEERWALEERSAEERAGALDAQYAERIARAEAALSEAQQASPTRSCRIGGGRRRRRSGRLRWWRRLGCGRSGLLGIRSGCCASMGRPGMTCRRIWIMCGVV